MYSLNKLESYSGISALGPAGHCTSHFKRAVCISCRPCVDVHKGEGGSGPCGQGEGGAKNVIFFGRHKWMAPKLIQTFRMFIDELCHDLVRVTSASAGAFVKTHFCRRRSTVA